ncbi:hypothetical protein Sste5344_006599 [Sporothrix stenoceras]
MPLDAPNPKRLRVSVACDQCKASKKRCLQGIPCANCTRRKIECTFSTGSTADNTADSQAIPQRRKVLSEQTAHGGGNSSNDDSSTGSYSLDLPQQLQAPLIPLLDWYFNAIAPSWPVVERADLVGRTPFAAPLLTRAVCLLSALTNPNVDTTELLSGIIESVRQCFDAHDLCARPSMSTLQALLLLLCCPELADLQAPVMVTATCTMAISLAVVSSALQVSPDGTCGGSTGLTCAGSTWGTCCSAHGYCGSGDTYCGKGCDLSAGTCNPGQGTPGGAIASKPTGEEGGGTACPVCPVCTICMSPSPTPVPSTCRLILTATKWETAITTRTVGVANGTAVDMPTQTATSTATITKAPSVTTKTATVTQTLIHTQTETLTVAGTVAADAVSPTPATAATPAAAAVILESTATPSPILPGIVAGCHRWYKTPRDTPGNDDSGGSTCRTVAEAAGISKDDLRLWNTRIGNTSDDTAVCEGPSQLALLASNLCRVRCGELWGGYYLCVGAG